MRSNKEGIYKGRRCVLNNVVRVRHTNHSWGYYNRGTVLFLDDVGKVVEVTTIPLGKFNKGVKWTGKELYRDGQLYKEV